MEFESNINNPHHPHPVISAVAEIQTYSLPLIIIRVYSRPFAVPFFAFPLTDIYQLKTQNFSILILSIMFIHVNFFSYLRNLRNLRMLSLPLLSARRLNALMPGATDSDRRESSVSNKQSHPFAILFLPFSA